MIMCVFWPLNECYTDDAADHWGITDQAGSHPGEQANIHSPRSLLGSGPIHWCDVDTVLSLYRHRHLIPVPVKYRHPSESLALCSDWGYMYVTEVTFQVLVNH